MVIFRGRRAALLLLIFLAASFGAAGIFRVRPAGEEIAVVGWIWGGEGRSVSPGLSWRVPLLSRLSRYAAAPYEARVAFRRGGGNPLASLEGAAVRLTAAVRLRIERDRAVVLDRTLGREYRSAAALSGRLHPGLRAAASAIGYDDLLSLVPEARSRIETALRDGAAALGLRLESVRDLTVWPEIYPEGQAAGEEGAGPVIVLGVDGADWTIIDPLMRSGGMPNLSRIVIQGVRARLKTVAPVLSPIVWTSIATGKVPEKHGIIDFLAVDAVTGREMPITSTMRKARAFWEILSARGISVGTVGWWATWPAEPLLGFQVSDRVAYQLFGNAPSGEGLKGRTWPAGLILPIARRRDEAKALAAEDARQILGRSPEEGNEDEQALLRILESTRIYHGSSVELLKEYRPRVAALYYEAPDTVSHLFIRYAPPRLPGVTSEQVEKWGQVVERTYRLQDRLIGEIMEAAGPGATFLVVSDHGFKTGAARPQTDPRIGVGGAADWHRKFGVFAATGPGIRQGAVIKDVSVLDVTPTLLAILGLPSASDMDGRVIEEIFQPPPAGEEREPLPPIATYEGDAVASPSPIEAGEASADVEREIIAKLTALGYIGQTGPNAENNAGIALLRQGRYGEAAGAFRRALERDPSFRPARVNLARALMALGDLDAALKELEAVRKEDPNAPDLDNLVGNIFMEKGDLPRAESTFRRALASDERNPHLWNSLGIVLARQGRAEDAVAAYRKVVAIDPDYAEAINNLGLILRDQGRLQEAIAAFEAANRADAEFPGSLNNLGLTYQDLGDQKAALAAFDRGLEVDPGNAVILNNRGSALLALGRTAEARAAFEEAVESDPKYASAHNNLGAVLGLLGDAEGEFEEYVKAIEIDPAYADARFNLALNLRRRGRAAEAEKALGQVLDLKPDHARARFEIGLLLAESGRTREALANLEAARAAAPRWPPARNALARLLAALGKREEALREARASLQIDPNQPEVVRFLEALAGATSGSTP